MPLFSFVAVIVHASIFCLRFFQKQSANQPKKYRENVLLLHWKAHAKIQVLLKENKFYPKVSLASLLHQAVQLYVCGWCDTLDARMQSEFFKWWWLLTNLLTEKSVFYASVLLWIINYVIILSKWLWNHEPLQVVLQQTLTCFDNIYDQVIRGQMHKKLVSIRFVP